MEKTAPSRQRLFVALALPPRARAQVARWQETELGAHERDLRLVPRDALHVTLAFLGNVTADTADVANAAFGAVGAGPAVLEVAGVAAVPPRRPRLWALDLADPGGRAAAIHAQVAAGLIARKLYEPEERPFWPHVTVARVRARARAPRVEVAQPRIGFTASEVVLYRSHVSRAGARYEELARRRLGATAS